MLNFGGSTFSFMWAEPALASMRRLRGIGLEAFDVITVPGHLWPSELDAGGRRAMAATLAADDIRIESLNLPALDLNLGSCVPEVRAFAVETYIDALRLSADLGSRGVVVVPGRVSGLLPPSRTDTLEWLFDGVETLRRVAADLDQLLFLETHPQTAVPTAKAMSEFVAPFADARVLVAYDVANAEFIGEDQVAASY